VLSWYEESSSVDEPQIVPVLVYIHGGGYVFGNPANWPFEHWIQQSPNVVVVSVYYRLSVFGFLSTPEFSDGKLGDLNAGFLDQSEALRWVQKHIDRFGGDPSKVTINGESAGGSSIELHLIASAGTEELFRAAIAQSVYRTPLPTPEQQQVGINCSSELESIMTYAFDSPCLMPLFRKLVVGLEAS
jgi:carboxylesterase type B